MSLVFTYSILRYSHSLALGESLNVGLLCHFPGDMNLHFVTGDLDRVKEVYPAFDSTYFNLVSRNFERKLKVVTVEEQPRDFPLQEFIQRELLPEDATALQFARPSSGAYRFASTQEAISALASIYLPIHPSAALGENRHNESYLVRRCTDLITRGNNQIKKKLNHNRVIEENTLKLTFDLAWKNGVEHLVKPVSFDLKGEQDIQDKSVRFFGYLNLLGNYAKKKDCLFDLLVSKPQDTALIGYYEKAIERLQSADAPLEVIPEERIEQYAAKTAALLLEK